MAGLTVNANKVSTILGKLTRDELPTATRNMVNDLARDIIKREKKEMKRVFDQPTTFVLNSLRIKEKATKQDPTAVVWIKDVYGKNGDVLENTLTPHIPGFVSKRKYKGMERALQHLGLMRKGQYLVPSRTMRLNRYGNITGSTASKMLNDVGAFINRSGFRSTTGESKRRYIWGTVKRRGGGTVTGIWLQSKFSSGKGGALQMVVVDGKPTYAKRFKFHAVAEAHAKKRAPYHAKLALQHALSRRL